MLLFDAQRVDLGLFDLKNSSCFIQKYLKMHQTSAQEVLCKSLLVLQVASIVQNSHGVYLTFLLSAMPQKEQCKRSEGT